MAGDMILKAIAHIHTDFKTKFGVPRQSGLVEDTVAWIEFEPPYRKPEAFRGIEDYSHLWLIWQFSESLRDDWSPTVRPPRLGGNRRMGVFATRSPYRPNALGLSSVQLDRVEYTAECGPIVWVRGADLMDGTPLYDIKPYLPYTDSHPKARGGFGSEQLDYALDVSFPPALMALLPEEHHTAVMALLAQDPRPAYQQDESRVYGFSYAGYNIRFQVKEGCATVIAVTEEVL